MKIELHENKVYFNSGTEKKEIHPFWLRERANGENLVDEGSKQRLFDPTELNKDIEIKDLELSDRFLKVSFTDGVKTKLPVQNIINEFSNIKNNFEEDYQINENPKYYKGYSLGDIAA